MPSGTGRSPQTGRYGKADMAVMVMSAFFAGSIPSAEALPRHGVSSAPATTKRCRGTGKDSFSGPAERTCCRFQPEPSLAWAFWGKGDQGEPSTRRVPPDTGPQDVCRDGEEDPSLRRRLRYRQQGQWPPVSHCFLRVLHKECYNDILQLRSSLCNTVQNVRQSGL